MTVFPIIVSNALWLLFNFNPFFFLFLFTLYYMLAVGKLASHCFRMTSLVLFKCVWPSLSWLIMERECRHFCACFTFQKSKGIKLKDVIRTNCSCIVLWQWAAPIISPFLIPSLSFRFLPGFLTLFWWKTEDSWSMHASLETVFTFCKFQWPKKEGAWVWLGWLREPPEISVCLYLDVAKHEKKLYCVVKSSRGHVLHFPSLLNKTLSPWSSAYIPVFEVNQKPFWGGGGGSWCEKQWRSGLVC